MADIVSASDLKAKIDAGEDFVLLNALGAEQFAQMHIPGSVNIPTDEVGKRAEKEIPEKNKLIVTYCASELCKASPQAASTLESMGYTNVKEFKGGLKGWEGAGYKLEGTDAS
ncbi:rhodanese-like domain-containing protein [Candidatus Peregrinibacteria bacterium CG10_big_fil_rev_8_21_14_0_10_49_10]|nr:MAG: rhodanese-like domain-containing protein [Candidatus Peregrinibacteria bacterium CG10_big_fil_rev_8_21_14_0_10_49_10]